MTRAPVFLPVQLDFPPEAARRESWGRLTVLTGGGAELSTATRLVKGERVLLAFELGRERFEGVRARVESAEDDADGRRLAELRFEDPLQRRALAKALTDLLS
ncbi:MAG: hypothetical protein KGM24_12725 [Elusimicrobia bacterium]|nr:hypothetical protein [Elusimicrobiota bacterium]